MHMESSDLMDPDASAADRGRSYQGLWPLRAVAAGLSYAAIVFLIGSVAGVLRELFVAPRITSDLAIVAETPLMCWIALLVARGQAGWLKVPASVPARLIMGMVALALLVWGENLVTEAWMGRSIVTQWSLYGYLAAAATFAGLAWFWLAPLLASPKTRREP